jgi:D-alanyl-D-alanine carboxypeptidase
VRFGASLPACLAVLLGLVFHVPESRGAPRFSERAAAAIEDAASAHIAAGKSAGLAIQVVQDGQVVFSRGYGKANLEWDQPVTPDTVFRIASNTKTFSAVAVLLLAQNGALTLDDRLSKFFPDFPRADAVTIRQLLTHTSGITSYDELYRDKPELTITRSMEEMIEFIARLEPTYRFEPGTAYGYSNSGYYVLGAIARAVHEREHLRAGRHAEHGHG